MAEGTHPAQSNFPLLWRWNRDTHAKLSHDELESIRPLPEDEAAVLCDEVAKWRDHHNKPQECLNVDEKSDETAIANWLNQMIPNDANELLLIWDHRTAARVPRVLFVRRWNDFWYPSSDDLCVISADGGWHLEMHHHGSFEFSNHAG
jgi:hypothetical protein